MATLSPSERTAILFAAQVIDAEVHGRRKSQASADLRALLASSSPPPVSSRRYCDPPDPGEVLDYSQIGDYCTGPDETEEP